MATYLLLDGAGAEVVRATSDLELTPNVEAGHDGAYATLRTPDGILVQRNQLGDRSPSQLRFIVTP